MILSTHSLIYACIKIFTTTCIPLSNFYNILYTHIRVFFPPKHAMFDLLDRTTIPHSCFLTLELVSVTRLSCVSFLLVFLFFFFLFFFTRKSFLRENPARLLFLIENIVFFLFLFLFFVSSFLSSSVIRVFCITIYHSCLPVSRTLSLSR